MDDKDRLDCCMKVAEYWASRHDARREFEWKVALAWWGLLVLATRYVHPSVFQAMSTCQYVILSGSAALVLVLSFAGLWLYPLWRANMRDRDKAHAAAHDAAEILLNPATHLTLKSDDEIDVSFKRFAKDWAMRFHALTTLILIIVLCISARY